MDNIEVTRPISKIESHRIATRTDATPVAWMDFNTLEVAIGEGLIMDLDMDDDNDLARIEWVSTSIANRICKAGNTAATDVAALVDAAKALEIAVTFADPPKLFNDVLCHDARVPVEFIAHLRQALAPFTKGKNDE